jgi:acyl-CoA synthetase (AMP-forming)/AMP-acid ligase II
MRRRKCPTFSVPFITLICFDTELQKLSSEMGLFLRFCGVGSVLKALFRWVRTGDKVVIDENNDVFIVDRIKVALVRFPACSR